MTTRSYMQWKKYLQMNAIKFKLQKITLLKMGVND